MVYTDCPMDARDFTDYRSTSDINNELLLQIIFKIILNIINLLHKMPQKL